MTLVERIANLIKESRNTLIIVDSKGYAVTDEVLASTILQAILADPSIIEVDTKAKLPRNPYLVGELGSHILSYSRGQDDLIKAGWVKPKE